MCVDELSDAVAKTALPVILIRLVYQMIIHTDGLSDAAAKTAWQALVKLILRGGCVNDR